MQVPSDLAQMLVFDEWQPQGQGSEIIGNNKSLQFELALKLLDRKGPRIVGQLHSVRLDSTGYSNGSQPRNWQLVIQTPTQQGLCQSCMVLTLQNLHMLQGQARSLLPSKAGVCPTDIGEHAGLI